MNFAFLSYIVYILRLCREFSAANYLEAVQYRNKRRNMQPAVYNNERIMQQPIPVVPISRRAIGDDACGGVIREINEEATIETNLAIDPVRVLANSNEPVAIDDDALAVVNRAINAVAEALIHPILANNPVRSPAISNDSVPIAHNYPAVVIGEISTDATIELNSAINPIRATAISNEPVEIGDDVHAVVISENIAGPTIELNLPNVPASATAITNDSVAIDDSTLAVPVCGNNEEALIEPISMNDPVQATVISNDSVAIGDDARADVIGEFDKDAAIDLNMANDPVSDTAISNDFVAIDYSVRDVDDGEKNAGASIDPDLQEDSNDEGELNDELAVNDQEQDNENGVKIEVVITKPAYVEIESLLVHEDENVINDGDNTAIISGELEDFPSTAANSTEFDGNVASTLHHDESVSETMATSVGNASTSNDTSHVSDQMIHLIPEVESDIVTDQIVIESQAIQSNVVETGSLRAEEESTSRATATESAGPCFDNPEVASSAHVVDDTNSETVIVFTDSDDEEIQITFTGKTFPKPDQSGAVPTSFIKRENDRISGDKSYEDTVVCECACAYCIDKINQNYVY